MNRAPDTFERSMAHWSEAGRAEMEAFYAVATQDYRELARAHDWSGWIEGRSRILDVACGSGKFPAALARYARLGASPLTLDLLDPSRFSLEETIRNLRAPFRPGKTFPCRIQDLAPDAGPWPAVWATHALYAVPPSELPAAMARFVEAIAPGGVGFIAHARAESFYLAFHRAYLRGLRGGEGTPFSSAEEISEALRGVGVRPRVRDITYVGALPPEARIGAEGFLRRCLFDETVALDTMEEDPEMGPLLARHRAPDGGFRFPQRVAMIFIEG